MRFLLDSPWWLAIAVLAFLGGYTLYWFLTFQRRFEKICHDAVLEVGKELEGAQVQVHAVQAARCPEGPSPFDIQEGDEEYDEEVDGQPWDEDGCGYYSIDATITPADPDAKWDPTTLTVIPADFEPDDEVEISPQLGGMHSAERFVNGRWVPLPNGFVRGPQRLRMLFAVSDGLRAVKFSVIAYHFGHVDLPAPLPKAGSRF
jgi:hypothetical protein